MNRTELAKGIYDSSHITGEFKLRSGVISNEYFDKYQFESNPALLMEIAKAMVELLPEEYDVIAGLEMGGIPLATIISSLTGKPLAMVRKKAKEYGTMRLAEGADIKDKKVVVIEDVVTSAGQVVISSGELRERGAIIENAICVIDRESGGPAKLKDININLSPLFTMTELKKAAE